MYILHRNKERWSDVYFKYVVFDFVVVCLGMGYQYSRHVFNDKTAMANELYYK